MAADSMEDNPFRSPTESGFSLAEGCGEAFIRLAGIAFAGMLFAFFAFNAIDSLRPHSIIQENPRAHPPTPLAIRVVYCSMHALLAAPALGTMILLAWPWGVALLRRALGRNKNSNP
jgi:hypothetical protein